MSRFDSQSWNAHTQHQSKPRDREARIEQRKQEGAKALCGKLVCVHMPPAIFAQENGMSHHTSSNLKKNATSHDSQMKDCRTTKFSLIPGKVKNESL